MTPHTHSEGDLLSPRYEVIADYPKMPFTKNEVLELRLNGNDWIYEWPEYDGMYEMGAIEFNEYPHLFRLLSWWERRGISEMPEYVWYDPSGFVKKKPIVLKIKRWVKDLDGEIWADVEGDTIGYCTNYMPKPATLGEYESFNNKK